MKFHTNIINICDPVGVQIGHCSSYGCYVLTKVIKEFLSQLPKNTISSITQSILHIKKREQQVCFQFFTDPKVQLESVKSSLYTYTSTKKKISIVNCQWPEKLWCLPLCLSNRISFNSSQTPQNSLKLRKCYIKSKYTTAKKISTANCHWPNTFGVYLSVYLAGGRSIWPSDQFGPYPKIQLKTSEVLKIKSKYIHGSKKISIANCHWPDTFGVYLTVYLAGGRSIWPSPQT